MKMRKLAGDDLWTLLDIITLLDITDEAVSLVDPTTRSNAASKVVKLKTKKAQEEELNKIGKEVLVRFMKKVLSNLKTIRQPLNELLADLTGTTTEEIKALELKEYVTLVADFFKKPELADLVRSIAGLLSNQTATTE